MPAPVPHCIFCAEDGVKTPAAFLAAQSVDAGATVEWVLICRAHGAGWNDGGDWQAPIYRIGKVAVGRLELQTELIAVARSVVKVADYAGNPWARIHTATHAARAVLAKVDAQPASETHVARGRQFALTIDCETEAFGPTTDDSNSEVARLLRKAADDIEFRAFLNEMIRLALSVEGFV